MNEELWPALPLDAWEPTCATLHRWLQIVGKTRLALSPFENHWWHCALYVTSRGVATPAMPYGAGLLDVELDVLDERLVIRTSAGDARAMPLAGKSVADFYAGYVELLTALGAEARMVPVPNELPDATPFGEDRTHASYDGAAVRRWWRALAGADRVLKRFRSEFAGKCSPSHLWWGALDIACTRFSGRRAPAYRGVVPNCPNYVMVEAYSHECISAGWWPGTSGSPVAEPAWYAYAYPEPSGCDVARVEPAEAYWHPQMREWILPYEAVRTSSDPDAAVMRFLRSTYAVAADLGGWDVAGLRSSRADDAGVKTS